MVDRVLKANPNTPVTPPAPTVDVEVVTAPKDCDAVYPPIETTSVAIVPDPDPIS